MRVMAWAVILGVLSVGSAGGLAAVAATAPAAGASPAGSMAATSAPTSRPVATTARTEHYDVVCEGFDAELAGMILEELHSQLTKHFGKAPAGRLTVGVFADRAAFQNALRADRQFPVEAGGYYAPSNHKVYLFRQPSDYFTRQLLLHEATHQFHWLVASGNKAPSGAWYDEGLSEYFGMHNWDGRGLQTGVVPAITLEDYPAAALKALDAQKDGLAGIVAGTNGVPRPVAWAMTHFLISNYPEKFADLAGRLDRQADAAASWKEVFGDGAELSAKFRAWIVSHAQPWRIVWVSWQERGDALEGKSQTNALAVLKETPAALSVELEPVKGAFKAGLVFGFQSAEDFYVCQLSADRSVRILRYQAGKWQRIKSAFKPAAKGRDVLTATLAGNQVTLSANGVAIATLEAPGQLGLNCDNCEVLFRPTITAKRD
jgi:hypothetical protein